MFCPKCGSSNDDAAKFCVGCGNALSQSDKPIAMRPAQAEEPASDQEYYKAVLGPMNQDYYLDHFSRFDDEGRTSPTWNWSALLVTFYWLLYRKMWAHAAIYLAFPFMLWGLFWIVGAVAGGLVGIVGSLGFFGYAAVVLIVMPMYANALYYRHCRKMIETVRASTQGTQRQLGELAGKGGTSRAAYVSIWVVNCVAVIGVLVAIAIPAYQDHAARVRMAQALTVGRDATAYVDGYFNQYRSIPRNLDAADFMSSLPPSVKAVSVDNQTGTIAVTMKGGKAIDGKSLKFVSAIIGGDHLSWTCMSDEIQDRYLPQDCRSSR
jgi:Tfp pilus assembly major pilin PilA